MAGIKHVSKELCYSDSLITNRLKVLQAIFRRALPEGISKWDEPITNNHLDRAESVSPAMCMDDLVKFVTSTYSLPDPEDMVTRSMTHQERATEIIDHHRWDKDMEKVFQPVLEKMLHLWLRQMYNRKYTTWVSLRLYEEQLLRDLRTDTARSIERDKDSIVEALGTDDPEAIEAALDMIDKFERTVEKAPTFLKTKMASVEKLPVLQNMILKIESEIFPEDEELRILAEASGELHLSQIAEKHAQTTDTALGGRTRKTRKKLDITDFDDEEFSQFE